MKNNQQATHGHKKVGTVIVLESTGQLAKVLIPTTDQECWVKLEDLTPLTEVVIDKPKAHRTAVAQKSRSGSAPHSARY
jgi:hypothetical protein